AARELFSMREQAGDPEEVIPAALAGEETWEWTHTLAPLDPAALSTTLEQAPGIEPLRARADAEGLFSDRPPIPPTWRGRASEDQPDRSPALIALRPAPIVGRDAARDELWSALRRAREHDRAEIVLLVGPTGSGRTQLADWLAERARELGVAGRLWASFGPGGTGLSGMIRRTFLLWGVEEDEYASTLAAMVPPLADDPFFDDDVETLARLAGSTAGNRREEFVALRRLIRRLGRINLPGLYLDDADRSPEALAFLEFLTFSGSPSCVVVACVDKSTIDDPAAPPELVDLLKSDSVRRVDIDILNEREHREFLRALAPLNPAAVEALTTASLGSPALAVELVLDWMRRGQLVETDEGLELSEKASEITHRTAGEVAISRIARVVGRGDFDRDDAWKALEVAAIMGDVVEMSHWSDATGLADLDLLLQQVAREGVGTEIPGGFAFSNGLLRQALIDRARDRGRYQEWHEACARALGDPGDDPQKLRRVANHWVEAGQPEEALEHLLQASRAVGRSHGNRARLRLLEYRDSLLDRLGVEEGDPRRVTGLIHRQRCHFETRPHESLEVVESLQRRGWLSTPRLAEQALRLASMASRRLDRIDDSVDYARQAVEQARRDGEPKRLHQALIFQARMLGLCRRYEEAAEVMPEIEALQQQGVERDTWCLAIKARIEEGRGEADEARRFLREAIEQATAERAFAMVRTFHGRLGELERFAGNPAQARAEYETQRELARRAEEEFELFVNECNLALTDILAGEPERARPVLGEARARGLWASTITRAELACDVLEGRFEAATDQLESFGAPEPWPPPDDPWLLEIAARAAEAAGQAELARRCERRASAERRRLNVTAETSGAD
ncbi:MAG: hypothetical protein R3244_10035, partial [Thermoanaerobaculia bacterium]|nr:hypothetical protein [Thermoanaerobaculia bacterium]